MKKALFLSLVLSLACVGASAQHRGPIVSDESTQVKTAYGTVQGYLDGDIYTFKGIQYAKADRFIPPTAPDSFTGVRMARIYGPQAPQDENLKWNPATSQTDYNFGNNFVIEPMDEKDCLVLNVWTKGINDGKKRPVFIWLHGGGFNGGSAHDLPCYEGRSLAEKGDIVVVSLNHRLNVLGFLDLTALGGKYSESVNLGLQDIVKALEWVHGNIDKFGGDPGSVTIAGQSGGGRKVSTLMAVPSAKGLFQRAIVQSGSALEFCETKVSQRVGLLTLENLGIKPSEAAQKLDSVSYEDLVKAGDKAIATARKEFGDDAKLDMVWCPSVGNKFLPTQLFVPTAPLVSKDVTMMIGCNYNELHFDISSDLDRAGVIAELTRRMGAKDAEKYLAGFEAVYPDKPITDVLFVDTFYRPSAIAQATAKSRLGGAPAYVYFFMWKPEGNVLGASHGMELPFMFNNVDLEREMTGGTERAYRLQEVVSDAWLSFIKTGKPAAKGMPEWEAFNEKDAPTMIIDDKCTLRHHFDDAFISTVKTKPGTLKFFR